MCSKEYPTLCSFLSALGASSVAPTSAVMFAIVAVLSYRKAYIFFYQQSYTIHGIKIC